RFALVAARALLEALLPQLADVRAPGQFEGHRPGEIRKCKEALLHHQHARRPLAGLRFLRPFALDASDLRRRQERARVARRGRGWPKGDSMARDAIRYPAAARTSVK